MQYGDQVLTQLDDFEDDDQPDILKKIQEEGLHRGGRRGQVRRRSQRG